jgi:hypothetical protein
MLFLSKFVTATKPKNDKIFAPSRKGAKKVKDYNFWVKIKDQILSFSWRLCAFARDRFDFEPNLV